jgi:dihydrofolate reductase
VKRDAQQILDIKKDATSDIYLCGGGAFAGWLLELGLINQLKIKLNPIILGDGIRLFGTSKQAANWQLTQQQAFEDGLLILTYDYQKN